MNKMPNHSTPALSITSLSMAAISMPVLPAAALQPSNNGPETPANAHINHKNNHSSSKERYQHLKEKSLQVAKHGLEIIRDIHHIRSSLKHRHHHNGAIFETEALDNSEPWLAVSPDDGDGVADITATVGDMPFSLDVGLGDVAGGLDADTLEDAFAFVEEFAEVADGLGEFWDTLQSIGEVVFTIGGLLLELLSAF